MAGQTVARRVAFLALVTLIVSAAVGCVTRAVTTTTSDGVDDEVLTERVATALASASDVDADRITIEASGGVVTVNGLVANGLEQQSVGAIVRAIPGVEAVRFSLAFEPTDGQGDSR